MFTDDNMSAHYLKHWHINHSWHCWESLETKDTQRCILKRKYFFLKLEHLRTFWNQGHCMVHSGSIWNDVLEVGTAEKNLKARTQNVAFCRCLERFLTSWNCWENFESKEASWWKRTLIWYNCVTSFYFS